jgi:hypothetical protein
MWILNKTFGSSNPEVFISLVSSAVLIITAIIALRQLNVSKEIARATFVMELNKSFVENSSYIELYNFLQTCYDGNCTQKCVNKVSVVDTDLCNSNITKGTISNYLTFFEAIYILKKSGAVDFELLDDLFAYRFFLVVHSKLVQQEKLSPQAENFANIFRLEYEWLNYRKKCHKDNPVGGSEKSVYQKLPLKSCVGEDKYNALINRRKSRK